MLRELSQWLEETWPGLARALGGRPDLQLSALTASLLVHASVLTIFALIGHAAYRAQPPRQLETELVSTKLTDFAVLNERTGMEELDHATLKPQADSAAPVLSPLMVPDDIREAAVGPMSLAAAAPAPRNALSLERPPVSLAIAAMTLPGAPRLDSAIQIHGSGAEHVGGVKEAVDRVAVEILRRMEKGRTLVVWAFDASGSLVAERQRLARYIDHVYENISEIDKNSFAGEGGLLTAVVAFGKERKIMAEPTSDRQAIMHAIESIDLDETGVENTFAMVADIARKFGRFKLGKAEYSTMTIVVTDETGDDDDNLETAIAAAKKARMPVYVLGSPALFGQTEGFVDYTDPKTNQTYHHLPVHQGPESLLVEVIHLPFWYDGPRYEFLDSGFGPWGLSRLAGASGGIYFITRMGAAGRITFNPDGMKEYKPDWSSRAQYQSTLAKDPLRQAVVMASQVTQQNLPGQPALMFPPADTPAFKEAMFRNQEIVARVQYTVDEALAPIVAVARLRDHETSRRWQAHYDLILGRLRAVKLRCEEYNLACARMKKDAKKFSEPKFNAWRLVPDDELRSSKKAPAEAEEPVTLLERVVKEHPGTPWALLARRELKDPFGFRWVETYVPPPPKPREGGEPLRRKAPTLPSAPPPKL